MTVLKLGAVDFDDGVRIAEKRFSSRFDAARLPRASGTEKQEVADGSADWTQTGDMSLISPNDLVYGFVLPDDKAPECSLKPHRFRSRFGGVKQCKPRSNGGSVKQNSFADGPRWCAGTCICAKPCRSSERIRQSS